MINCRICGKEYKTLEEAMDCEQKCYAKLKENEKKQKEEINNRLAKADEERIQKEYEQLTKDIKHHVNTYGERVSIDTNKAGSIDSPFYVRVGDPFWEFNNMF